MKNLNKTEATNKKLVALKLARKRKSEGNITFMTIVARLVDKATLKDIE